MHQFGTTNERAEHTKDLMLGDRDRFLEPAATGTGPPSPSTANITLRTNSQAVGVHSITYDMAGLQVVSGNVNSTEVVPGQGSGPNTRPHVEEAVPSTVTLASCPLIRLTL